MDMRVQRPARERASRMDLVANAPPFADWPAPDSQSIEKFGGEALYARRRRAVVLWVEQKTEAEIRDETGLPMALVRNVALRCLKHNQETKNIFGFWPCLPSYRVKKDKRTRKAQFNAQLVEEGRGLTGALEAVLRQMPHIERELIRVLKTRRPMANGPQVPLVRLKTIHGKFLDLCRAEGWERQGRWPFCTKRLGQESLRLWFKRACATHYWAASDSVYGAEVAANDHRDTLSAMHAPKPRALLAYERVETDEHHFDATFTFIVKLPNGVEISLPPIRPWVLVLIERASSAVLAARLCFRRAFDSEDVKRLLLDALDVPTRLSLTLENENFRYSADAAFPGELSDFEGQLWQLLAFDSHASHLSEKVTHAIKTALNCGVDNGPPAEPRSRACIEGFFAKLAEWAGSTPTSVGNHPGSPQRRTPEVTAEQFKVSLRHAQEMLDVFCRNYNGRPQQALGGLSPLQELQRLRAQGCIYLGRAGDFGPSNVWKLLPAYKVTVSRRRGPATQSPFVVRFKSALYTGPTLAQHRRLAYESASKWTATLYVYDDARRAKVVLDAFPDEVHDVVVHGRFSDVPMTLQMRQLVASYSRNQGVRGGAEDSRLLLGVYVGLSQAASTDAASADLLRVEQGTLLTMAREGPRYLKGDVDLEALKVCMAELDDEEDEADEGGYQPSIGPSQSSPHSSPREPSSSQSDPLGLFGD